MRQVVALVMGTCSLKFAISWKDTPSTSSDVESRTTRIYGQTALVVTARNDSLFTEYFPIRYLL